MKCDEYLQRLAIAPVAELQQGHGYDHAAECAECARVTNIVLEREQRMMLAVTGYTSAMNTAELADAVLVNARRRKVGTWYMIALGVLFAATAATIVSMQRLAPSVVSASALHTETFPMKCLAPQAAGEIVSPYVRANGSAYYASALPTRVLTVRTTDEELQKVRSILDRFDNAGASSCTLPR